MTARSEVTRSESMLRKKASGTAIAIARSVQSCVHEAGDTW